MGVREYYLLDPKTHEVEAFVLQEGCYVVLAPEDGLFPSQVLGKSWDPASVLPDASS